MLEVRAVKCLADRLFDGAFDIVARPGYVGAIGFLNGRPIVVMVRSSGRFRSGFGEFKRVYGVKNGTIVFIRTGRVRAASFLKSLIERGYTVHQILVSEREFRALARCSGRIVDGLLSRITQA